MRKYYWEKYWPNCVYFMENGKLYFYSLGGTSDHERGYIGLSMALKDRDEYRFKPWTIDTLWIRHYKYNIPNYILKEILIGMINDG